MSDSEEIKDCKTNGQTYTFKATNWPEEKCSNAIASAHSSRCMFLHTDQDNRCDNVKNKPGDNV